MSAAIEVFWVFLRLGCTSFGGPAAHIGFFREVFVQKRGWLSDRDFGEIIALTQFLPGPASSQTGMAIGLRRAGAAGMAAAFVGFTLPSALIMLALGLGLASGAAPPTTALLGLKAAAAAVVLKALWDMGGALCPDRLRRGLALSGAAVALLAPGLAGQLAAVALGAAAGLAFGAGWVDPQPAENDGEGPSRGRKRALLALALFVGGLLGLPALAIALGAPLLEVAADYYRIGGLVFGGGHVVLPLMHAQAGAGDAPAMLAGYGAAQALPGPLFAFAAFTGVLEGGLAAGVIAVIAIFAPSFFFIAAATPLLALLRGRPAAQAALAGVNAAVVGLLLAAVYDPVWTTALAQQRGFLLLLVAVAGVFIVKPPIWATVLGVGALGAVWDALV